MSDLGLEGSLPLPASGPEPSNASDPAVPRVTIMTADELTRVLTLRWRTIALVVVIAVGIAAGLASLQPKVYRASSVAAVIATADDNMNAGELYRGVEVLEQRTIISTVAALASLPTTAGAAAGPHARGGHYDIAATVLPNTSLLRIDVDGPDPAVAAVVANRVPAVLAEQTRVMYRLYGVRTMSVATVPTTARTPRLARAIAAGVILGLMLGAGIAISVETLKRNASG